MVEVCLPGTGGMIPLENRHLSCCWMEYQGSALLIDCGEGTQVALRRCGLSLGRLDTLLVTHYHADHIAGLPGLLLTLGNFGKTSPLTLAGPRGLEYIVSALTVIAPVLPYQVELLELDEKAEGHFDSGLFEISHMPLNHRIPCLGYRVEVRRKPVFNPQKAGLLGIPKRLYGILHSGKSARLDDGRVIQPEMVLDGVRPPVKVCYCTDSLPVPEIADFASSADLLISEGMYGEDAMRGKMEEKYHMVFSDSAGLAKEAGAGKLWLTHFSPALTDPESYIENARRIFPESYVAFDGIRTDLTGAPAVPAGGE